MLKNALYKKIIPFSLVFLLIEGLFVSVLPNYKVKATGVDTTTVDEAKTVTNPDGSYNITVNKEYNSTQLTADDSESALTILGSNAPEKLPYSYQRDGKTYTGMLTRKIVSFKEVPKSLGSKTFKMNIGFNDDTFATDESEMVTSGYRDQLDLSMDVLKMQKDFTKSTTEGSTYKKVYFTPTYMGYNPQKYPFKPTTQWYSYVPTPTSENLERPFTAGLTAQGTEKLNTGIKIGLANLLSHQDLSKYDGDTQYDTYRTGYAPINLTGIGTKGKIVEDHIYSNGTDTHGIQKVNIIKYFHYTGSASKTLDQIIADASTPANRVKNIPNDIYTVVYNQFDMKTDKGHHVHPVLCQAMKLEDIQKIYGDKLGQNGVELQQCNIKHYDNRMPSTVTASSFLDGYTAVLNKPGCIQFLASSYQPKQIPKGTGDWYVPYVYYQYTGYLRATIPYNFPDVSQIMYTPTVQYEGNVKEGGELDPDTAGTITFTPNESDWTHRGRTANGEGLFGVQVDITKDTIKTTGKMSWKIHGSHDYISGYTDLTYDDDGNVTGGGEPIPATRTWDRDATTDYTITYKVSKFTITGAKETECGNGDTVHIDKQGAKQVLTAKVVWDKGTASDLKTPDTTNEETATAAGYPESFTSVYPPPSTPSGTSGEYNIDWTNPTVSASPTCTSGVCGWSNTCTYPVTMTATDQSNLSGIAEGKSVYLATDSSILHNIDLSSNFTESAQVGIPEGVYSITASTEDNASTMSEDNGIGNQSNESKPVTFEQYKVDKTPPTVTVSPINTDYIPPFGWSPTNLTVNINPKDNVSGFHNSGYAFTDCSWYNHQSHTDAFSSNASIDI